MTRVPACQRCLFFVLKLPTSTILADHLLECSKSTPPNNDFETISVANKAEVPILFNVILALHTSIHGSTRILVLPLAIENIKYYILRIFSTKKMKNS